MNIIYTFIYYEDRIQHSAETKTDRQTDKHDNTINAVSKI